MNVYVRRHRICSREPPSISKKPLEMDSMSGSLAIESRWNLDVTKVLIPSTFLKDGNCFMIISARGRSSDAEKNPQISFTNFVLFTTVHRDTS